MNFNPQNVKVAFVCDSMPSFGGSDRHLYELLNIFPNSEIFTTVYNPKTYNIKHKVNVSFINNIPLIKRHLSFLYPFVLEQFTFDDFDIVISISAGPAKGIITRVNQPHISIICTPPRHYWDRELNARGSKLKKIYSFGSKILTHYLRIWDISAFMRIDYPIAISNFIASKIKKTYRTDVPVIYPSLNEQWYIPPTKSELERISTKYSLPSEFLLVVSRLYDHKRVDWAIKAAVKSNTHLYICGVGPDFKFLKKLANNSEYVHFLGHIPEEDLKPMFARASCFIFPPIEDFGYTAIESMAQGVPVLSFNYGGGLETILEGKTGEFFSSIDDLTDLISKKVWKRYNKKEIINNAKRFSTQVARDKIIKIVKEAYENRYK